MEVTVSFVESVVVSSAWKSVVMPELPRRFALLASDIVGAVCGTSDFTCIARGPLAAGILRNTPLRRDRTAWYSTSFGIAKTCESICSSLSHVQKAPRCQRLSPIEH